VHQVTDGAESDPKNLIGALAANLGDHADTARIALVSRIIERGATQVVGQGMIHNFGAFGLRRKDLIGNWVRGKVRSHQTNPMRTT
jgi:hypothetical protein